MYHKPHFFSIQGIKVLRTGGSALKAVTVATSILEDSKVTNAGSGSNLTWDGQVECDAGLMEGKTGHFGAVGT
jgi:Asparaginase